MKGFYFIFVIKLRAFFCFICDGMLVNRVSRGVGGENANRLLFRQESLEICENA